MNDISLLNIEVISQVFIEYQPQGRTYIMGELAEVETTLGGKETNV